MWRAIRSLRRVRPRFCVSKLSSAHYTNENFWGHFKGNLQAKQLDFKEIPIVDLSSLSADGLRGGTDVVDALRHACSNVGFFYVKSHGVPQATVDHTFDMARKFFAMPAEHKMSISCEKTPNRGYFGMGGEILGPKKAGDLKEGVDIGLDLAMAGDMKSVYELDQSAQVAMGQNEMLLPNTWPPVAPLPGYREAMAIYFGEMMKLSFRLIHALSRSLDIDPYFFDKHLKPPMASLRILHYPPHEGEVSDENLGAGPHTDYGMLTVLAQDSSGLQVQNRHGEWIEAPVIPGTFIVNLGDMTQRFTNDFFKSTPHRVINLPSSASHTSSSPPVSAASSSPAEGRHRYSIPFFFEPNYHALVETLPQFINAEHPAKYPPKQFGQHLKELYNATYAYKR